MLVPAKDKWRNQMLLERETRCLTDAFSSVVFLSAPHALGDTHTLATGAGRTP